MFARIVACVDASPAGQHVLEVATEMATRFGCGLTLLTVLPWKGRESDPELERLLPMDAEGRPIHRVLEDGQSAARARGVSDCAIEYLRGNVVESVLRYLQESPPDLVVVGTRGLSRGSRMLLGSVSSSLVRDAPCPVLVVRHVVRGRRPTAIGDSAGSATTPTSEGRVSRAASVK